MLRGRVKGLLGPSSPGDSLADAQEPFEEHGMVQLIIVDLRRLESSYIILYIIIIIYLIYI